MSIVHCPNSVICVGLELANINELRRFVLQQGSQFGVDLKLMNKVIRDHTGLVRLYFDASYQERKNGTRLVNYETGEIEGEIEP